MTQSEINYNNFVPAVKFLPGNHEHNNYRTRAINQIKNQLNTSFGRYSETYVTIENRKKWINMLSNIVEILKMNRDMLAGVIVLRYNIENYDNLTFLPYGDTGIKVPNLDDPQIKDLVGTILTKLIDPKLLTQDNQNLNLYKQDLLRYYIFIESSPEIEI